MQNATHRFRSQSEPCVTSACRDIIASIFFNCHGREVCVTFVRRLSRSNDLTCLPLFSACSRAREFLFSACSSLPVEFSAWLKRETRPKRCQTRFRAITTRVTKQSPRRQTTVIIVKRVIEREREIDKERWYACVTRWARESAVCGSRMYRDADNDVVTYAQAWRLIRIARTFLARRY